MDMQTGAVSPTQLAPRHDPVDFFDGQVQALGVVLDRAGVVRRRFSATFNGQRDAAGISIVEVLTYDDGEIDRRNWRIEPAGANAYAATAEGLAEPALIALTQPGEARWTYQMDIPIGKRVLRFGFQDIMVQLSADTMVSHTPMRKFGITWASITTTYQRV